MDLLAHVTMRDKRHQKVENIDMEIIENTPIMEYDRNLSTTNKNNEFSSEKNNRKLNMPAITGHKEVIVKVCREFDIHPKKTAIQVNQTTDKEDKPKIKKSITNGKNTTNNIVDKMADSAIICRKRKLYSSKIENTHMETDKPIVYISETENDSNSLSVFNKFKEFTQECRNCIKQPQTFRSKTSTVIFPRSQNLNQEFDQLKKEIEFDEKIILVDKNKANQVFNFTSESEDEDFKKEKINFLSGLSMSRNSVAKSKKHGRPTNRVNYAETQPGSPKDKVIKKANKIPGKKIVKPKTRIKQTKNNTIPRNEIIDEIMRTAPSEIMNTSLIITTHRRTLIKKPIVDDLGNDEHVETTISEKKESKKKNSTEKARILKNKKVVNKIVLPLVIKSNEHDKSPSPLPELEVETVTTNKNDSADFMSVKNIIAWRKMYDDPEYDNAENTIQNLPPDLSKINNTLCDTINKALIIDLDKQNIIESHHTVEERQKEATQCKITKIKESNTGDNSDNDDKQKKSRCKETMDNKINKSTHESLIAPINLVNEMFIPISKKTNIVNDNIEPSTIKQFLYDKDAKRKKSYSEEAIDNKINKSLISPINLADEMFTLVSKNTSIVNDDNMKPSTSKQFLYDKDAKQKKTCSKETMDNKINKSMHEYTNYLINLVNDDNMTPSTSQQFLYDKNAKRKKSHCKETLDKNINKSTHTSLLSPVNLVDEMFIPISKKPNIVNDDNIKPSTSEQFLYDKDAKRKKSHSEEAMDNKINKSTHKSLISPINLTDEMIIPVNKKTNIVNNGYMKSSTSQLFLYSSKDSNISIINNDEELHSLRKGSSVGNAAMAESNYSANDYISKLTKERTQDFEEILECSTATENSGHEIKIDDNTASNAASTISPTINRQSEHNNETSAEAPENITEEHINACLENLETALVDLDVWTHKTKTEILLNVAKQKGKAQEIQIQNMFRDLEEKFKENDKQTQETMIMFVCNVLSELSSDQRKSLLHIRKTLNASYRAYK